MHILVSRVITEGSAKHCMQKTVRAHLALMMMMMMARAAMIIQANPLCHRLLRTEPLCVLIFP